MFDLIFGVFLALFLVIVFIVLLDSPKSKKPRRGKKSEKKTS